VGVASHPSHRSGRAQLTHPVRLVRASLSRFAIRGRYVDPQPGCKAPVGWPTHDSLTSRPLPSPGSPRYRFPCFQGTMERCDSLGPFHRASLSFAWRYHASRLSFRSLRSRTPNRGPGVRHPVPTTGMIRMEAIQGLPGFWTTLMQLRPVLRPRPERTPLAVTVCRCCPRGVKNEGSMRVVLSGLDSTALLLAVYASPSPLRCRRRKTRFRLLARLYRVGLATHRVVTKGF
jgi:hypothetical protein